MRVPSQHCGKVRRLGPWCLALAALWFGFSGCKGTETRADGLRHSDLAAMASEARSKREDAAQRKQADDPRLSEKANQVSRDLQ
jgi:hypothetical protein